MGALPLPKKQHEPKTRRIAVVRTIHQRDYFRTITIVEKRKDGWILSQDGEWYAPSNVVWAEDLQTRQWNGNAIAPGTLCKAWHWRLKKNTPVIVISWSGRYRTYKVMQGAETCDVSDTAIVPFEEVEPDKE
jgi:hypothetical protein